MLYAIGSSNGNLRFGPTGCVRRICFPRVALPTVKFVSRSLRLYSLLGVGSVRVVVGRESGRAGGEVTRTGFSPLVERMSSSVVTS